MRAYRSMVYVVEGDDAVKIGQSIDPESRRYSLSIEARKPLRLVHSTPPLKNAGAVERTVHAELKEFRLRGEWFTVSADFAARVVTATALRLEPNHSAVPLPSVKDVLSWWREDKPCPSEYRVLVKKLNDTPRKDWPERWRT